MNHKPTATSPPTTLNAKPHTITLQFSTSPDDQALFAALMASSDRAHRNPLGWQVQHLLRMVFGLREINLTDAGLDHWPGGDVKRKGEWGRVLRLVSKNEGRLL